LSQSAIGRRHFTTLFQEKVDHTFIPPDLQNDPTKRMEDVDHTFIPPDLQNDPTKRMEDKTIDELIQELKDLQLREAEVLVLIERANARRDELQAPTQDVTSCNTNSDS
jgi:hypothetical protein